MRAGMQYQERQLERGGESQFLDERLDGFGAVLTWPCAEVNEIRGVAEDRGKTALRAFSQELFHVVRRMRAAKPLHIILDEYLDGCPALICSACCQCRRRCRQLWNNARQKSFRNAGRKVAARNWKRFCKFAVPRVASK